MTALPERTAEEQRRTEAFYAALNVMYPKRKDGTHAPEHNPDLTLLLVAARRIEIYFREGKVE